MKFFLTGFIRNRQSRIPMILIIGGIDETDGFSLPFRLIFTKLYAIIELMKGGVRRAAN